MDTKINTFIFDCFGVVCTSMVWGWYKDNMLKRGFVDENLKNILEQLDLGKISEDDIITRFLKHEGINLTREKLREEIDNYLKLDDELVNIILKLKNKGFKIILLSNAPASVFERKIYVEYPQFKTLFDEIIISSNVGMVKPNKDIYLYTIKKINSKPEEALFIDDSQINIDGAVELGIKGFLYTDVKSFLIYIKTLGINLTD